MEESNYIKIYTGNFVIIPLIQERLNEIGITPIIKDEAESGRLAGFPTAMQNLQEVYVHKDEYDKAVQIVERIKTAMESNKSEEL